MNDHLSSLPTPAYSLADLVHDVRTGRVDSFTYAGESFGVIRTARGSFQISSSSGQEAIVPNVFDSMDLHGPAAYLRAHPQTLVVYFDRDGNVMP